MLEPTPARSFLRLSWVRFALFTFFPGSLVFGFVSATYMAAASIIGVSPVVAGMLGFVVALIAALWVARMIVRETSADRSQNGQIIHPIAPTSVTVIAAWWIGAAIVITPLMNFPQTIDIGAILATIFIGAFLARFFVRLGRDNIRSTRRLMGRCQRCGYDISGNPYDCPECADPNLWRFHRSQEPKNRPPAPPSESYRERWSAPDPATSETPALDLSVAPVSLDSRRSRRIATYALGGAILATTLVGWLWFDVVWPTLAKIPYAGGRNFLNSAGIVPTVCFCITVILARRLWMLRHDAPNIAGAHRSLWPTTLPALLFLHASDRFWRIYPWLFSALIFAASITIILTFRDQRVRAATMFGAILLIVLGALLPPGDRARALEWRRRFNRCRICVHAFGEDRGPICRRCGARKSP